MAERLPYEQWAVRLCERFFGPENAGVAVTFFVDSEAVSELAEVDDPVSAERSLADAVRSKLASESTGDLFSRIVDESWNWKLKSPDSCPVALPMLAVAVLAASKMERTGEIAANNYYKRFREVLRLPLGTGMPPGYGGAMETLWRHLEWWLDDHKRGEHGASTIAEHPRLRYIGYALSQALFRASDRQRLTHFFNALDLRPGQSLAAEELLAYFRAWAMRAHLSGGAVVMARTEAYAQQLSAILTTELARWDGSLRDERGRRLGQILVALDLYLRPKLAFVAERPSAFPLTANFRFEEGREEIQVNALGQDYYGELPLQVTADRLDRGLRLEHDDIALALSPSPIVPLRQNEGLGCWASVRQLVPGAEHWLLVRDDESEHVKQYLSANAMSGWSEVRGIAPKGWHLVRDVVLDASPTEPVGPALSRIVPSIRERPAFWGGLPLSFASDVYLSGGEPDVWMPELQDSTSDLSVDGAPLNIAPAAGRIQLRGRGLLPGNHEVRIGPTRLRFQTIETVGLMRTSGTGSIAHELAHTSNGYEVVTGVGHAEPDGLIPLGHVLVVGLEVLGAPQDLPPLVRPPLLLPAKGHQYVLLGSQPGQVYRPSVPPEQPHWLDGVLPFSAGREVHPPFDVVWVVIEWGTGRWDLRLRDRRDPLSEPDDEMRMSAVQQWCRYFLELSPTVADEDQLLWQRYRDVAMRLAT